MRNRRDKMQIIEDILRAAEDPRGALKTHLVYGANLNFARLETHLDFLLDKGLLGMLDAEDTRYQITMKGRDFLKHLKETRNYLGS